MVSEAIYSQKLVYPAEEYHRYLDDPGSWKNVFGDGNYSMMFTGRAGSAKDTISSWVMNYDLKHSRTVIILDIKMEYPCNILCQCDVVLRNILIEHGLVGRGYKVILWLPYIKGMDENEHFQELLKLNHPNLEIRPFRILCSSLISEDSANMAMSKSQLQSMADKDMELSGNTRILNELREHMAKMKMAFDDKPLKGDDEDPGWDYINFDEMTTNGCINVISTFFMMGKNIVAATSFMIGILNELMTIGKGVHRYRSEKEVFSVIIPEVQIIMPKRVKALEAVVNTLKYSMLVGLLLMRSFGVRLRINLQNLSSLDPDMLSQSRIFVGKTWNPKDLNLLNIFGINKTDRYAMMRLRVGQFVDVMKKTKFSVVPYSHKARANEPFIKMMRQYYEDPSAFLFPTRNGYLTEIIDYKVLGGRFPMTVKAYNQRVKEWLNKQNPIDLHPIPENSPEDILDLDETFEQLKGVV